MKKIVLFVVLTVFWLILLFPKNILWNSFVQYAEGWDIRVVTQKKEDKRYKYTIGKMKIFLQNMQVATVENTEVRLWVFYNEIDMNGVELNKNLPIPGDLKIQNLKATYTVLSPERIKISGYSVLGYFTAEIEIFKHTGYVLLKTKDSKNSLLKQYFKKTKEGMRYDFAY